MKYTIKESQLRKIIQKKIREALEVFDDGMEKAFAADQAEDAKNFLKNSNIDPNDPIAPEGFVDSMNYRNFGNTTPPSYKRLKQKEIDNSWDALDRDYDDFKQTMKDRADDGEGENLNKYDHMSDATNPKYWPKNESKNSKQIKLTEQYLHSIVKESVKKVLEEHERGNNSGITKEKIIQCFDDFCYHYCGTRWSDIGDLGVAVAAFRKLFYGHPSISVRGERVSQTSNPSAYRNWSNSSTKSLICIQSKDDKTICFGLHSFQFWGSNITYNGKNMVSASDNSIKISDEFVDILNGLLLQ